jgi:hypothetical protein
LSDRIGKCALQKRTRKKPKKNENFITKVRATMAMLMMNYVVYGDDVFYFSDVVDFDHQLLMMTMMNLIVMVRMRSVIVNVNVIDFDYYLAEIVCDDDDDFYYGDVCEISSFSSFSYV